MHSFLFLFFVENNEFLYTQVYNFVGEVEYNMLSETTFEFRFSCPFCKQKFEAEILDIGMCAICPTCKREIVIEPRYSLFDNLNHKQKKAATTSNGIIRVIAGAGTGKTRVLVYRLACLIQFFGIPQDKILSVTFTNKAAGVMKKRAKELLGDNFASRISTFHGFCHELLKEDIHYVNFPPDFTILDTEDQKQLLQEIYAEEKLDSKFYTYQQALRNISDIKHIAPYVPYLTQADMRDVGFFLPDDDIKCLVFNRYLLKQRRGFYLDFDDLILFAIYILANFDDVREKWNDRIHYVQVDEFQDVNGTQFELLNLLIEKHKNLFVVGDPDQNIYTWRGADVGIFLRLKAHAEEILKRKFLDVVLDDNYRSSQAILDISNQMIMYNTQRIHKNLHSVVEKEEIKPLFYHAKDNILESKWLAAQIQSLVQNASIDYNDIVVLLRGMPSSRTIESIFVKEKIPYRIINGLRFYERKEIKDILAYLRFLATGDDLAFSRIINMPPRGIGETRRTFLRKYAEEHNISLWEAFKKNVGTGLFSDKHFKEKIPAVPTTYAPLSPRNFVKVIKELKSKISTTSLSQIVVDVLLKTGYDAYLLQEGDEERKDNLLEFKSGIISREKEAEEYIQLNDYLNEIALYAEQQENSDDNVVRIMTIHSAKGLEFPFVFVPFFNEGFLPSRKAHTPEQIEEERRVAYVAFTRAENQLFLSNSDGNETNHYLRASRFLTEIRMDFLQIEGVIPAEYWTIAKQQAQEIKLLSEKNIKIGDIVEHEQVGNGKVIAVQGVEATILFQDKTEKTFHISVLTKISSAETDAPSVKLEPALDE